MSNTPRTDAQLESRGSNPITNTVSTDFARTLERELNETNAKLSQLSRMIDIASQANDAASEAEVANSATFAEALAHTNAEMVEAERDQLKAELKKAHCQFGTCSVCGFVAWTTRPNCETQDCEFCRLKAVADALAQEAMLDYRNSTNSPALAAYEKLKGTTP